jgi:hypothetical protein
MGLPAILALAILLAASPVGAWYTHRHPAVRNDTWGGALGLILSWPGVAIAVGFCAWRAARLHRSHATGSSANGKSPDEAREAAR